MDSLFNILSDRNFDEPPEVAAIKKYVQDNFKTEVSVMIRDDALVITASSAALVNTLRLRSSDLKRRCQIDKKRRLLFRIG